MVEYFADADPLTVLSSGNYLLLLAFIVVVLVGVIIWQQKRMDTKDTEIRDLNKLIYTETKANATDYKDMARDNATVLSGNSQNMALLSEKIEVVKGKR